MHSTKDDYETFCLLKVCLKHPAIIKHKTRCTPVCTGSKEVNIPCLADFNKKYRPQI